jgi:hypothetical protein
VEATCYLLQNVERRFAQRSGGVGQEVGEAFVQSALGFGEEFEEFI